MMKLLDTIALIHYWGGVDAVGSYIEVINQDEINSLRGDLLIAAVAKAENAPVVTRNTDDFNQFAGVSAESY